MARYQSELTGFLHALLRERPEIERTQREGRAMWWDRSLDPDELRRWQDSRVRQSAYVYYEPPALKDAKSAATAPASATEASGAAAVKKA